MAPPYSHFSHPGNKTHRDLGARFLPRVLLLALGASLAALLSSTAPAVADSTTVFNPTGAEQMFVVPAGVYSVHVDAIGCRGETVSATGTGGAGAQVTADLAVTPGQTLYVEVAGDGAGGVGGFNGGANGGGGGGGASDIRTVPRATALTVTDSRLLVAGGGGGGGTDGGASTGGAGGAAGAAGSQNGSASATGGQPGTQVAGGTHGTGTVADGSDGTLGDGGAGGAGGGTVGGGGGGGLYGGGGGGGGNTEGGSGGGGGSSKVPAGGSLAAVAVSSPPVVEIRYTPDTPTSTGTGTQTTTTETSTTSTPTTPTPTTTTTTTSPLSLGKISQGADGTLTLTLKVSAAGALEALASYPKKASRAAGRAAALRLGKGQLVYSRAKRSVTAAGTVKLKLKPTKAAKKALAQRKVLRVKITTRFTPKTGSPSTKTKTVTVRFKKKGTRAAGAA